jgi:hypothetical protein
MALYDHCGSHRSRAVGGLAKGSDVFGLVGTARRAVRGRLGEASLPYGTYLGLHKLFE